MEERPKENKNLNFTGMMVLHEGNTWLVTKHDDKEMVILPEMVSINNGKPITLPPDHTFERAISRESYYFFGKIAAIKSAPKEV